MLAKHALSVMRMGLFTGSLGPPIFWRHKAGFASRHRRLGHFHSRRHGPAAARKPRRPRRTAPATYNFPVGSHPL